MKHLLILLFVASALYAQCPLGFTPEQTCNADNPSCALYVDGNGDSLCDNPGPQSSPEPAEEPEEIVEPDVDPISDPVVIEEEPELENPVLDPFCPLNLTPQESCTQANARCTFYTDSNNDGLCDNPGPQPVEIVEEQHEIPEVEETEVEEVEAITEEPEELIEEVEILEIEKIPCPLGFYVNETCPSDDAKCTLYIDLDENGYCDNGIIPVTEDVEVIHSSQQRNLCPLKYTEEQACTEESPDCAFYVDADGNGLCDNPGPGRENGTVCAVPAGTSRGLREPSVIGCPLGLPPEAACPDSLALCPHWYGVTSHTSCANPAGGNRRISIILITLGFLLPVSTWLSRKVHGRRLMDRLKRNTAHNIIRGVSLMILGFGVQGCFCPLGTFQYAFTAEGLAFLGLSGILIFLLPLLFSAFFGRVFCGWVCPFGALQEFLYSIKVPGRFSPSGKFHKVFKHLNKVILFGLISAILLNRFDIISLRWSTPFCAIDPFHTIFTLFLSGSLVVAGITILLALFVRRFFCKYLCFYGAAQSLIAKLTLWNKIKGIRSEQSESDSDQEFDS